MAVAVQTVAGVLLSLVAAVRVALLAEVSCEESSLAVVDAVVQELLLLVAVHNVHNQLLLL